MRPPLGFRSSRVAAGISPPARNARQPRGVGLLFLLGACGSTSSPPVETVSQPEVRYPRRASGCDLAIYYSPVPGVAVWDDLGVAEAACHISDPVAECLRRLKAEACQLGGDMIYNVPRKPLRPRDQVLLYRGQVAHTRAGAPKKFEDPDLPSAASAEESAGPIVPLPSGTGAEATPIVPAKEGPQPSSMPTVSPRDAH